MDRHCTPANGRRRSSSAGPRGSRRGQIKFSTGRDYFNYELSSNSGVDAVLTRLSRLNQVTINLNNSILNTLSLC